VPLQVNSETERGNLLLQTVEKLKYEGADLKLEMDLKKVEKAVKVESSLYLFLLLPCAP